MERLELIGAFEKQTQKAAVWSRHVCICLACFVASFKLSFV